MKKKLLFLFAFTFLFLFSQNIFAAGVKVTPFRIEETVKPGESLVKFITVTNDYDETKVFYTFVKDFIPQGEGGEAMLVPADPEKVDSLVDWVLIQVDGVELVPGERREIPVHFQIPENAGPGGYYGAVIFGPEPPKISEDGGTIISMTHQIGVLALLNVEGDAIEDARIREFFTDKSFYDAPFEINFNSRIENFGNLHIKPIGVIEITNMRGSDVIDFPVNIEGANVLPGSIRKFETFWEDDFGFGKYNARLAISFGRPSDEGGMGMRTISAETSFWIIPLDIIIQSGIALLILTIIIYIIFKRSKNKAIKQAMERAGITDPKLLKNEEGNKKYIALIVLVSFSILFLIFGMVYFLFFV